MPLSRAPRRRSDIANDLGIDWAICLVRWGLIVLVPILAVLDPEHRFPLAILPIWVLAVSAYNLVITALLALRVFFRAIPTFTLIADVLSIVALMFISRQSPSLFFFLPLFPILVATLRLGWLPGLLTAAIFALSAGLFGLVLGQPASGASQLFQTSLTILLYALAAIIPSIIIAGGGLAPLGRSAHRRNAPDDEGLVPERLKMIYDMASTLSATLNYERVLEAILDISRLGLVDLGERLGESAGIVLLYDQEGLYPASHRNLVARGDDVMHIQGMEGIVGQAISSGEAVIGTEPASDPELAVFGSLQPCKSMICVPMRAGFETYGVVLFASVHPGAYTREHLDLLTIFCNQATIALQNASLYQTLRQERDKIVDKEEQARRKLARDLHDGPTQDVAAIAMRLNFARMLLDRDPSRARSELERLEDLAHRTVKEIRSMLFTLRPVILETEGLIAALNQYAEQVRENDSLPVVVEAERYRDCLDSDAQGVVFSIIEEAVNNARKHARASRVTIRLAVQDNMFFAQVEDNGRGFDVQATEQSYSSRGSLGMINLKERATLVEGRLTIESAPGQGTRVILLVPLHEDAL